MNGSEGYSVYLFPQALEALGEAVKPYLSEGKSGAHVLCREIDTAGALVQMTLEGTDTQGKPMRVQLMLPSSMVRMIVSARGEEAFGFMPRGIAVSAAHPDLTGENNGAALDADQN